MKIVAMIITIFSLSFSALADIPNGEIARKQLLETGQCPGCDLRGVDLSNQKLIGANLEGADLSGAKLKNTNLRGANLQGATLLKLDLTETRLAGANLKYANLSDQDIDVQFEYVEIMGTQLEGARFKYGVVCGALPDKGGWGCQGL